MKKNTTTIAQGHGGFVILFVVLIAAIILLIGAGIFTISFKENILSSSARESQLALAAADSGIECALYHDVVLLAFSAATVGSIECADQNLSVDTSFNGFEFILPLASIMNAGSGNLPCAHVTIDKDWINPDASGASYTWIVSRGYNVCDSNGEPLVTDPLLLERVLDVKYPNATASAASSLSAITPIIGVGTSPAPSTPADSVAAPTTSATRSTTTRDSAEIVR